MAALRSLGRRIAVAIAMLLTAFCLAGTAYGADGEPMRLPSDPVPLLVETGDGDKSFTVEVADDAAERSQGLMFREHLGRDRGMLFVFQETRPASFWMKNTPLPLDLVFIDETGRVVAVKQGEPFSEAMITPGVPVRYVLELEAGTAAREGISKGDRLRHPAIDATAGP